MNSVFLANFRKCCSPEVIVYSPVYFDFFPFFDGDKGLFSNFLLLLVGDGLRCFLFDFVWGLEGRDHPIRGVVVEVEFLSYEL